MFIFVYILAKKVFHLKFKAAFKKIRSRIFYIKFRGC